MRDPLPWGPHVTGPLDKKDPALPNPWIRCGKRRPSPCLVIPGSCQLAPRGADKGTQGRRWLELGQLGDPFAPAPWSGSTGFFIILMSQFRLVQAAMEPFLCASLRAVSSTEVVGTKAPPTGQTRKLRHSHVSRPPREEQCQACPLSGPLTQVNRARHLHR